MSTKTILYTMSDILDKLNNLEHNLNLLNKKIDSTNLENTLLKDELERLKNHQPTLTKEIGEDFEQYFVDKFNSLKQVALSLIHI